MTTSRAIPVSFLLALANAQQTPADPWIAQLTDSTPAARAAARDALLALGADAVAPLSAKLAQLPPEHAAACLEVLTELGPQAGAAVPALVALLRDRFLDRRQERAPALVATLAELLPFHEGPNPLSNQDRVTMVGPRDGAAASQARWRLFQRESLALKKGVDPLQSLVSGHEPLAVELAIERLGAQGASAKQAVPQLRALLDREEPRLLLAGGRLPLHRKAAKAILQIAPDSPEAAAARQVLAGKWSLPDPVEPKVPERLSVRIGELLTELRSSEPERRSSAADNLVAIGTAAARPVATLLVRTESDDTLRQALDVLRRLGKHAAPAASAIADALLALPAPHPPAVLRALAAVVPWSTDVLVLPFMSWSIGHLIIHGRDVEGTIDAALLDNFTAAQNELWCALAVPVKASAEELEKFLESPMVGVRKRALEVIGGRGPECEALLPQLESMLEQRQPKEWVSRHVDGRQADTNEVDRTDAIQRLAAETMLLIGPADHPLLRSARARLAEAAGK
ncbi:MAG: hypothetical protein MUC36_00980 [Planctomycetes bacterium]|jgi:hypothetical protein|nr:hypothetical protein [Planctomycetota bacterium]